MAASRRPMPQFKTVKRQRDYDKNDQDKRDKVDGRVGRLDEHTMGYYRRVADTIKDGFQDEAEQGLFLDNVFSQMEGEQVQLCRNQTVSRILEDVLALAGPSHLGRFLEGILADFPVVVKDRFAGHVVQKALLQAVRHLDDEEEGDRLQAKILSMAELLVQDLDSVMGDTYGNHILRTMVQILGGVRVPDQVARSRLSREQQDKEGAGKQTVELLKDVPEKMQLSLKKITNSVLSAASFTEYLLHRTSSPVLEVLLLVLRRSHPGLCHRLCQAILKKSKVMTKSPAQTDKRIPVVLTDSVGSHLFEIVIEVTTSQAFPDVYSQCFRAHLLDMALHPLANFVLQRLIKRAATEEEEFSEIFDQLCANIEAVLGVNHMGVVLRLAEACTQHPTKQSAFLQALLSAFHCWQPKERQSTSVLLIAGMVTHDVLFPPETPAPAGDQDQPEKPRLTEVNLHGSLLLQQLLKFSRCGPMVAGFLALSDEDLVTVACSPSGSYLLEAFVTSRSVSEKKKEKFAAKMKANCFKMACHKTGSRSIEAIFKAASITTKSALVQALAEKDKQLQSDHFGKFVYRNCGVGLFKHRQRDWEELQGRESKKRKLFADIIGDEKDQPAKKKKQKQSGEDTRRPLSSYAEEMKALGMAEDDIDSEESDKGSDIDDIFSKMTEPGKKKSKHKKSLDAKGRKETSATGSNAQHPVRCAVTESETTTKARTGTEKTSKKGLKKKKSKNTPAPDEGLVLVKKQKTKKHKKKHSIHADI